MKRRSEKKFRLTVTWKLAFFLSISLALAVSAREILSASGVDTIYSRVALSALTVVVLPCPVHGDDPPGHCQALEVNI